MSGEAEETVSSAPKRVALELPAVGIAVSADEHHRVASHEEVSAHRDILRLLRHYRLSAADVEVLLVHDVGHVAVHLRVVGMRLVDVVVDVVPSHDDVLRRRIRPGGARLFPGDVSGDDDSVHLVERHLVALDERVLDGGEPDPVASVGDDDVRADLQVLRHARSDSRAVVVDEAVLHRHTVAADLHSRGTRAGDLESVEDYVAGRILVVPHGDERTVRGAILRPREVGLLHRLEVDRSRRALRVAARFGHERPASGQVDQRGVVDKRIGVVLGPDPLHPLLLREDDIACPRIVRLYAPRRIRVPEREVEEAPDVLRILRDARELRVGHGGGPERARVGVGGQYRKPGAVLWPARALLLDVADEERVYPRRDLRGEHTSAFVLPPLDLLHPAKRDALPGRGLDRQRRSLEELLHLESAVRPRLHQHDVSALRGVHRLLDRWILRRNRELRRIRLPRGQNRGNYCNANRFVFHDCTFSGSTPPDQPRWTCTRSMFCSTASHRRRGTQSLGRRDL